MPRVSKLILQPLDWGKESIGQRVARIRKERGFTHVELAGKIGIVQTLVTDYETDRLRLTSEMAVRFAMALQVGTDDLLMPAKKTARTNGKKPARKILRRLERIETLPKTQQLAILKTIDNALELHTLKTGTR